MSDDGEPAALDLRRVAVVARGAESLIASLPVADGRARTRQILKAKGVRIMRISLDAGQALSERTENAPVLIQTLQGRVTLTVADERIDMPAGAIVHLDRQLRHSVAAEEASHLMVTLLGPRLAKPRAEQPHAVRSALSHTAAFRSSPQQAGKRPTAQARMYRDEPAKPREWAQHNLVLAATGANAKAFDEITRRHAEFLGELAVRTARLLDVLAGEGEPDAARADLLDWVRSALLPQLRLEAEVLYPVVSLRPQQRMLVVALEEELARVVEAVDRLAGVGFGAKFDIAAAAVALRVIVGRHLTAEAEVLLPTLAISSDDSLASLLAQMDELLGASLGV